MTYIKSPARKLLALAVTALALGVLRAQPVSAATDPALMIEFTPADWSAPGPMVHVKATMTNTDPTNEITDASLRLNFQTGKFKPKFISAEGDFDCSTIKSGKSSTMKFECDGGTIPANDSVEIRFDIPTQKKNKKTSPMTFMVNGRIDPYQVTASDLLLIVPWYESDLAIKGYVTPEASLVGGTITYKLWVKNRGYAPSPATTVEATLPDGSTQSLPVPALSWGQYSPEIDVTFSPTTAGMATATFMVDPTDAIDEHNETNNSLSLESQVYTDLPDLKVTQDQPASVGVGEEFSKTLTITNGGTLVAEDIMFRDSFKGMKVLSVTADHDFGCTTTSSHSPWWSKWVANGYKCEGGMLNPGESATVTVMLRAQNKDGTVKNRITLDPEEDIVESNEDNNVLTDTIMVEGDNSGDQLSWNWSWNNWYSHH